MLKAERLTKGDAVKYVINYKIDGKKTSIVKDATIEKVIEKNGKFYYKLNSSAFLYEDDDLV